MPEPAIRLSKVSKAFGDVQAVSELSFSVLPGEVYGLLGPNGAGKTTALRVLTGLLAPSSGEAFIEDLDAGKQPEAAKARLGYLSATTGLYARLTAREFLIYFGRIQGIDKPRLGARIASLGQDLDIERLLDRRCEALSTGERQRVSLARAVLHDPPVLVLDEPTNGLDVVASRFLRDFVRSEKARGKAILFSTHYLAEAELLCDRVGLMFRGSLLREGRPAELRAETHADTLEQAFLTLIGATEPGVSPTPAVPSLPPA